jgi:hypothetical protein
MRRSAAVPRRLQVIGEGLELRDAVPRRLVAEVVDDAGDVVDGDQIGTQALGQHPQCDGEVLRALFLAQSLLVQSVLPGRCPYHHRDSRPPRWPVSATRMKTFGCSTCHEQTKTCHEQTKAHNDHATMGG